MASKTFLDIGAVQRRESGTEGSTSENWLDIGAVQREETADAANTTERTRDRKGTRTIYS